MTETYNPNQVNFIKAIADAIAEIKERGAFIVSEGGVSFLPFDGLRRIQDAAIEGIASQGKLPSQALTMGYAHLNNIVKAYDPEKEVVVCVDSACEITSREQWTKAAEDLASSSS